MYETQWGFRYLWHWMDRLERLDIILLGLMLACVVLVVLIISHRLGRYRIGDTASGTFHRAQREIVSDLTSRAGTLKSIATVSPFLGLCGGCIGILSAFRGYDGSLEGYIEVVATGMAAALIPTATGIVVAASATWSYNYLRVRIDLLESEISSAAEQDTQPFHVAQKLPLARRLSAPPFAVIAVPTLAAALIGFMSFGAFHPSRGLNVGIAFTDCRNYGEDRLIVLRITETGKICLNEDEENWNNLSNRLSEIYRLRANLTLYLLAEDGVHFQTVADAIDAVKAAQVRGRMSRTNIAVRLITPHFPKSVVISLRNRP